MKKIGVMVRTTFNKLPRAAIFVVVWGILSTTFMVYRLHQITLENRKSWVQDSMARQIETMGVAVRNKLNLLRYQLVEFAAKRDSFTSNQTFQQVVSESALEQLMTPFSWIALVTLEHDQWKVAWSSENVALQTDKQWTAQYTASLVQSLGLTQGNDTEVIFERISDPQGGGAFAMSVPVKREGASAIALGFLATPIAEELMALFKGSVFSVFLVNDSGFVLSHPVSHYFGNLLSEHGIVRALLRSETIAPTGHYEDLVAAPVLGQYARIGGTNIYSVVTTLRDNAIPIYWEFIFNGIVIGLVFGLLGAIILTCGSRLALPRILGRRPMAIPSERIEEISEMIEDSGFSNKPLFTKAAKPVSAAEEIAGSLTASGGATADLKLAKELPAISLFSPLTEESELGPRVSQTEPILKSAALSSPDSTILQKSSEEGKFRCNLAGAMQEALAQVQAELKEAGIEVQTDLRPCFVKGDEGEMIRLFLHMIKNAEQAMIDKNQKKISLTTGREGDRVVASITDTGHGMSPEKILLLEFPLEVKDRSSFGVGFSLLNDVLTRSDGLVKVERPSVGGTKIVLNFPSLLAQQGELLPELAANHSQNLEAMLNELVDSISSPGGAIKDKPMIKKRTPFKVKIRRPRTRNINE